MSYTQQSRRVCQAPYKTMQAGSPDPAQLLQKKAGGSPQRKFFWKIGVAESDGLSGIRTGADE